MNWHKALQHSHSSEAKAVRTSYIAFSDEFPCTGSEISLCVTANDCLYDASVLKDGKSADALRSRRIIVCVDGLKQYMFCPSPPIYPPTARMLARCRLLMLLRPCSASPVPTHCRWRPFRVSVPHHEAFSSVCAQHRRMLPHRGLGSAARRL